MILALVESITEHLLEEGKWLVLVEELLPLHQVRIAERDVLVVDRLFKLLLESDWLRLDHGTEVLHWLIRILVLEDVRSDETDGTLGAVELGLLLILTVGRADLLATEVELGEEPDAHVLRRLALFKLPVGPDLEALGDEGQQTDVVHVGLAATDF